MGIRFCPQCPLPDTPMYVIKKSGVEIDYCVNCRGVWLERGELDKLLEREASERNGDSPPMDPASTSAKAEREGGEESGGKHPRRKGILGELFDF